MKYSRQSEESRREWMLWMFERAEKTAMSEKNSLATKQSANRI
jgi:hypothetical protein